MTRQGRAIPNQVQPQLTSLTTWCTRGSLPSPGPMMTTSKRSIQWSMSPRAFSRIFFFFPSSNYRHRARCEAAYMQQAGQAAAAGRAQHTWPGHSATTDAGVPGQQRCSTPLRNTKLPRHLVLAALQSREATPGSPTKGQRATVWSSNLQARGMMQAAAAQPSTQIAIGLHEVQGKRQLLRTPSHLLRVVIGVGKIGVHD